MIIGFGHKSRVGKDTCSKFLGRELVQMGWDVVHLSFAAPLKEAAFLCFAWAGLKRAIYYENNPDKRYIPLPLIGKTPVQLWIEFGNNVRAIYENNWIEATIGKTQEPVKKKTCYIISDVRFPNEVSRVHDLDGLAYRITKSDALILESVSDNALNDYQGWDGTFANEGTLDELHRQMTEFAQRIG